MKQELAPESGICECENWGRDYALFCAMSRWEGQRKRKISLHWDLRIVSVMVWAEAEGECLYLPVSVDATLLKAPLT